MNTKLPAKMTVDEIVQAITGAERLLAALRTELEKRGADGYCNQRWHGYRCKLKPGHSGSHSQGFIKWAQ